MNIGFVKHFKLNPMIAVSRLSPNNIYLHESTNNIFTASAFVT